MDPDTWMERQEALLEDDLASGNISQAEFNKQMADLRREYRELARESAQDAYDREMDRW